MMIIVVRLVSTIGLLWWVCVTAELSVFVCLTLITIYIELSNLQTWLNREISKVKP